MRWRKALMTAPYSAKAVANYFLDLAKAKGESLDPMKLQKLVYFAHGWFLAVHGKPLLNEEVQAWDYGPVIATLYHEFKDYGSGPIDDYAYEFSPTALEKPVIPPEDQGTIAVLNRIWEVYGKYSGIQLSNMTHAVGAPWRKALDGREGLRSVSIPNDLIREHFVAKAKAA